MKRLTPRLYCMLILLLFFFVPQNGSSCGPFFPQAVFTFQNHPDAPLKQYAAGNLGVILPSFARSYLVLAWRHLSDRPLAPGETKGVLDYWRWKLKGGSGEELKDPHEAWLAARERIFGKMVSAAPQGSGRKQLSSTGNYVAYGEFQNCQADSYQTAVLTLNDRVHRFGAKSAEVREWLRGQDTVFSNCESQASVPAMVADNSPALLKADRRYQIAAAHFYGGHFAVAVQEFDQIARDKHSPWRTVAPYLAARAVARNGSPGDGPSFDEAEVRLRAIVSDNNQKDLHRAARRLLGYIAFRRAPEKRTHELGRLLSVRRVSPDFEQDMIDYTFGLDRALGEGPSRWDADTSKEEGSAVRKWRQSRYRALRSFALADEMTDWVLTFQESGAEGRTHAVSRWNKQRTLPWLVTAISKIDATDSAAAEITQAAEQVPASSAAYPTIAYHRVRLLLQAGEPGKARALLNDLLPVLEKKISASSFNLFLGQRAKVVTSLEDFLIYASRPSVGDDSWEGDVGDDWLNCAWGKKGCDELLSGAKRNQTAERRFDRDAALIFNIRMPLELLSQSALRSELPEKLRGELALATWTRAVMLGRHDIAATLVPAAERAYPVMKKDLDSYAVDGPASDKWHAALFTVLHSPGARPYVNALSGRGTAMQKIDSYRDNWWCVDIGSYPEEVNYGKNGTSSDRNENLKFKERPDAPAYPSFLTPEQLEAARSQWKELATSGTGPNYLVGQTLKWAKESSRNPRIPEALHLAVRTTRYGCGNRETSRLSRQAYDLLHSRYPNSKWAKETPFWY